MRTKILITIITLLSLNNVQAQLWSIQLDVDPTTVFAPATGLAGVGWTGSEFWVSKWADNNIYTADASGNMTGNFTIPGITGTRSITTDGVYMYIGANTSVIYQVNPITRQLMSSINTNVANCRYLTYDPTLDNGAGGFWTGAYGSDITAVNMTGQTLSIISAATHGLSGIYGMAYDGYSTGGPYLWAFDQGGNNADIIQLTILGVPTGIMHDAQSDLQGGIGGGTAGGLFICDNYMAGSKSMIGINQGLSLFSYELADPPTDDAILLNLDIDPYVVNPTNVNIQGSIKNGGLNPITSIDVKWSDGVNTYTDNLTGLNITMNGTYNFSHSTQFTVNSLASNSITVWLEYPADLDTTNNALTTTIAGVTSIPEKYTVGEEKTGSWCGWCPRGAVALAEMEATPNFIGIAVHNGDPMEISSYDGGIGTYIPGGYPGGGVDRVLDGDPSDFSMLHNQRVNDIVPCGVNSINASFDGTTNLISVSTEIEAFGEMSGNFRLSCVIVEDDLVSSGSGWPQVNYYSGGGSGVMAFPPNVNGGYNFSTGNDPAQPSDFGGYDHVARSLSSNNILGDPNSLPAGLVNVGTYNYTFSDVSINSLIAYNAVGFDWTKAYAVVMIVNASTGEILNAKKAALSINNPASSWDCDQVNGCIDPGTGNGQYSSLAACNTACITDINENIANLSIYPNPIKNTLNIEGMYISLDLFDMFGKLILSSNYAKSINVSSLADGIYLLNVHTEKGTKTQKITITK